MYLSRVLFAAHDCASRVVDRAVDFLSPGLYRPSPNMPRGLTAGRKAVCNVLSMNERIVLGFERVIHPFGLGIVATSNLIDSFGKRYDNHLRNDLLDRVSEYTMTPMPANHSHPLAAGLRTGITMRFTHAISSLGFLRYDVNSSGREADLDGCRYYTGSIKDMTTAFKDDIVTNDHILTMIDVDYDLDFTSYLEYGQPVLIYTFMPTRAAGNILNGTYKCNKHSEVELSIEGGATYNIKIWNHAHDHVYVKSKFGGVYLYLVEMRRCREDETRLIVLYTPSIWIPDSLAPKGKYGVERLVFSDEHSTVLYTTGMTQTISIGIPGTPVAVTIPVVAYEACKIRLAEAKLPSIATVERILQALNVEDSLVSAPVLYHHLTKSDTLKQYTKITTTGSFAVHYQSTAKPFEDGKQYAVAAAPPIVENPQLCPTECRSNDEWCIEKRVRAVTNNVTPLPIYDKYANEFASLLIPVPGMGAPLDYEYIYEVQNKPTQRARINSNLHNLFGNDFKVESFQKRECYAGAKAPRNISTVPADHTLSLSTYTYAFKKDILMGQSWYGPTLEPQQIAERIQQLAAMSNELITTDYSKFDGTISKWMRLQVERQCYLRWVSKTHAKELRGLLRAEYAPPAVTKNGVKYKPEFSRLSGSPLTTDGNTLINAFVSFATLRNAGYSAVNAMKNLGIYCGDDGINTKACDRIEGTAVALGLKIKVVPIVKNSPVPYCARYYADPWVCGASFCDPLRALGKLHLVTQKLNPDQHLFDKCVGYLITDSGTPIVQDWCNQVVSILKLTVGQLDFRASKGPYIQEPKDILDRAFEAVIQMSTADIQAVTAQIHKATTIGELPSQLVPNEFEIERKVEINGEICHPNGEKKATSSKDEQEERQKQKRETTPCQPTVGPPSQPIQCGSQSDPIAERDNCGSKQGDDTHRQGYCAKRFVGRSRNFDKRNIQRGHARQQHLVRETNASVRQVQDTKYDSQLHPCNALYINRASSDVLGQRPERCKTGSRRYAGRVGQSKCASDPCVSADESGGAKKFANSPTLVSSKVYGRRFGRNSSGTGGRCDHPDLAAE